MAGGHTSGSAVVGVTTAFTILAAIATALRLFTRTTLVHTAGSDDIAIVFATVRLLPTFVIEHGANSHYLGLLSGLDGLHDNAGTLRHGTTLFDPQRQ